MILEKNVYGVLWIEKKSSEGILRMTNSKRKIMCRIRNSQAEFIGHMMRKRKLEHLVTMGKICGKRSRGRQIFKLCDGLAAWLGKRKTELFEDTEGNRGS